jgi:hypothetical protein
MAQPAGLAPLIAVEKQPDVETQSTVRVVETKSNAIAVQVVEKLPDTESTIVPVIGTQPTAIAVQVVETQPTVVGVQVDDIKSVEVTSFATNSGALTQWEDALSIPKVTVVNQLKGVFDAIVGPTAPSDTQIIFDTKFVDEATLVAKDATTAGRHLTAGDYGTIVEKVLKARAGGLAPEPLVAASEPQAQKRAILLALLQKLPPAPPPAPPTPEPELDLAALIAALAEDPEVGHCRMQLPIHR